MKQAGFSLVEIMISLALGAILTVTVIQVMVSQSVTNKLNRALASVQENGRYAVVKLQQDIMLTGRYDMLSMTLDRGQDITEESVFLQNNALVLPNTFTSRATLGVTQGASGGNDSLVISKVDSRDCRGYSLGYAAGVEFPVVNEYFVEERKLKCRGFDLRVLRGQQVATGHNSHSAFTLLDNVEGFQVLYGVAEHASGSALATPNQYVTANNLTQPERVVAIRIAILIRSDDAININNTRGFVLLNEASVLPSSTHLYRQFEATIMLRNMQNMIKRSRV